MLYRLLVLALVLMGIAVTAGCTTTSSEPKVDPRVFSDKKEIIVDFNAICLAMLKGDIKTVYEKHLSSLAQKAQSYIEFEKEYLANKESWKLLFSGAVLKEVAPDEKMASALVVWGTGESSLIEFVKENNFWKINYLRGPALILNPGTSMQ